MTTDLASLPTGPQSTVLTGQAEVPGDFIAAMLAQTPATPNATPGALPNATSGALPNATSGALPTATSGALPTAVPELLPGSAASWPPGAPDTLTGTTQGSSSNAASIPKALPDSPPRPSFSSPRTSAANLPPLLPGGAKGVPPGSPAATAQQLTNAPGAASPTPASSTLPTATAPGQASSTAAVPAVSGDVTPAAVTPAAAETPDTADRSQAGHPTRSTKFADIEKPETGKSIEAGSHKRSDLTHAQDKAAADLAVGLTPPQPPTLATVAHTSALQAGAVSLDAPAPLPDSAPLSLATRPGAPPTNPSFIRSDPTLQPTVPDNPLAIPATQPRTTVDATPSISNGARTGTSTARTQAEEQDDSTLAATPDSDPLVRSLAAWTHALPQAVRPEGASFAPSIASEVRLGTAPGTAPAKLFNTIAMTAGTAAAPPAEAFATLARRLEVSVNDPVLGHVDVRAEMRGGTLYASIASDGNNVATAMPALHQFLQDHQVAVRSLDFVSGNNNSVTSSGDRSRESAGNMAGQPGSQQPSQGSPQNQSSPRHQQTSEPRMRYPSGDDATASGRYVADLIRVPDVPGVSLSGSVSIHI